jgi:outer membrane protein assembly factor BamB
MAGKTGKWEDNFNKIVNLELPVEGNKVWKFTVEEHKTKGTMQMNVRLFQNDNGKDDAYVGPTKNGFIIKINTKEEFNTFKETFIKYLNEVEDML